MTVQDHLRQLLETNKNTFLSGEEIARRLGVSRNAVRKAIKALQADGFDYAPVPPRYKTPYFSHIMGGYAAGYYAYIWSEVLAANTTQWVRQHGGLTQENGDKLRKFVLAPGGQIEAGKLFPNLSGYEAKIEPLLEARGLNSK